MARVTAAEVKEILETTLDDSIVNVFIIPANKLVDKLAAHDTNGDMDATDLKEVERWLAAHFTCIRDTRVSNEAAGPVSQGFQYRVDLHFNLTMYGGTAIALDTTGYLASLQKQAGEGQTIYASLKALGPVSSADIRSGIVDGYLYW